MRYLFLILICSLSFAAGLPARAWSLDLFCFKSTFNLLQQATTAEKSGQIPNLQRLLMPPPRPAALLAVNSLDSHGLGLQLDERTRFGLSAYPSDPAERDNEETEWQGPAFSIGLHCLLD